MAVAASAESKASAIVIRGAFGAGLGFAVRLGARVLLLLLAGRLYGAVLFGAFGIALSTVEVLVALAGLSTKRTLFLALETADEALRPVVHTVLDAILLVGGAGAGLGLLVAGATAAGPLYDTDTGRMLLLLSPAIAAQALLDVIFAATRWTHAIRPEVIGRSLVEPYGAVIAAAAAWLAGWRGAGLAIGADVGAFAALAYAAFALRRAFGPLRLGAWRPGAATIGRLLRTARANTALELLNAAYGRADIWLVGFFLGNAAAGAYNAARQFRTPIRQLRQSFDSLLTPVTASTLASEGAAATGRALMSAARLLLLLQFPILIGLAALGAPLLGLFGARLEAGYWALVILAAAEALTGALGVSDLLFVYRRPGLGLLATAVGMTAGALLGLWLTPRLGLAGAATGVLGGYAVHAVIRVIALRAVLDAPALDRSIVASLGAGCAGLAMVFFGRQGLVGLTLGLATYAALVGAWAWLTRTPLGLSGFSIARTAKDIAKDNPTL